MLGESGSVDVSTVGSWINDGYLEWQSESNGTSSSGYQFELQCKLNDIYDINVLTTKTVRTTELGRRAIRQNVIIVMLILSALLVKDAINLTLSHKMLFVHNVSVRCSALFFGAWIFIFQIIVNILVGIACLGHRCRRTLLSYSR